MEDTRRDDEFLLLLLSDANLPTGSFVASSGFEAHAAHGLLRTSSDALVDTLAFVRSSVLSYGSNSLPFMRDAHACVRQFAEGTRSETSALEVLGALDALCDAGTLNHVARRASRAQGVALLTLYSKGFAVKQGDKFIALIDALKLRVRRDELPGHLPVCWGVLTGALGLSADRAAHLHLFLHARALYSAAIRMNALGPYAAQHALLHHIRPLVDDAIAQTAHLRTGILDHSDLQDQDEEDDDAAFARAAIMPANTWPLGELIQGRHDQLHSRIFNS
ncbi:hypothetical protein PENSPDRAFT_679377 [Peniophora sp. CONT]|nr:hypothetical protein PENSPDRAFT_679377 [Peniophora sp. CONT]